MERKIDIAFISAMHAPFIQDDIDVLREHFIVRDQIGHGFRACAKILWLVLRSDIVYCWFASVYASLAVRVAKWMGIKSIVVIGGVDVAKDDDIGYGMWRTPWRARLVRYALTQASHVLAVDPSLKEKAVSLAGYQGENIAYVPTGYDAEFWRPAGVKVPLVLFVAHIEDVVRARVKGVDIFLNVAAGMQETKFILVGVSAKVLSSFQIPKNVVVHEPVERKQLLPFYQHAKVYCQPSRHEGLPNSLCEAMLCGCIPVASDVGGNRTAVGDAGFLAQVGDPEEIAQAIRNALLADEAAAIRARARIVSLFPLEKRQRALVDLITKCLA